MITKGINTSLIIFKSYDSSFLQEWSKSQWLSCLSKSYGSYTVQMDSIIAFKRCILPSWVTVT